MVLGDAHLDVVVRQLGPLAEDTDTPARTLVGPGGQAANVAAWVAALGGRSRLVYARGSDLAAGLVAADLAGRGVELAGPVVDGRTGVVVSLSDGGTRRSMITDRGVGPLFPAQALEESWLDGCAWLHLPAYSLVKDPMGGAARAAAEVARRRSARLSVDLSSTAALSEYGVDRFVRLLAGLRPDVVFGTQAECALIGELPARRWWLSWARPACGRAGASTPPRPRKPSIPPARAMRSRRATCWAGCPSAWRRRRAP